MIDKIISKYTKLASPKPKNFLKKTAIGVGLIGGVVGLGYATRLKKTDPQYKIAKQLANNDPNIEDLE